MEGRRWTTLINLVIKGALVYEYHVNVVPQNNFVYHRTVTTPNFRKLFQGHVRTVPGEHMQNFKGVSLAILELL